MVFFKPTRCLDLYLWEASVILHKQKIIVNNCKYKYVYFTKILFAALKKKKKDLELESALFF